MECTIVNMAEKLSEKTIALRREFHRYPEVCWTEFRTAARICEELQSIGYDVSAGDEVISPEAMTCVPDDDCLEKHMKRAIDQGADRYWVSKMTGGKTGVVAVKRFSDYGPTVALRFDMDANDLTEAEEDNHRPYREKFSSVNKGAMHACGHDGHIAVGLAVAEILYQLDNNFAGTLMLIFQPAEEGGCGAKPMVQKGIVDNVDFLLGMHLGLKLNNTGQLACNVKDFLAITKYDIEFFGTPSHAGAAPEMGRNALLAAATAALQLHALPRHSEGASRVNVGIMNAGTARNIVPSYAELKMETRGLTSGINKFMGAEAHRVIQSAADMYGVKVIIKDMGGVPGIECSTPLVKHLEDKAKQLNIFTEIVPSLSFNASEDCTCFMDKVQSSGGQAAYIVVGSKLAAGHHDSYFDFDEAALSKAASLLSYYVADILSKD